MSKRLSDFYQKNSEVSYAQMAEQSGIEYHRLLRHAHKPEKGKLYNPETPNFDALQKLFRKCQVNYTKFDWSKIKPVKQEEVFDFVEGKVSGTDVTILLITPTYVGYRRAGNLIPQHKKRRAFMRMIKKLRQEAKLSGENKAEFHDTRNENEK